METSRSENIKGIKLRRKDRLIKKLNSSYSGFNWTIGNYQHSDHHIECAKWIKKISRRELIKQGGLH